MNDDEIVIKPADKGIAIVVWSKKIELFIRSVKVLR